MLALPALGHPRKMAGKVELLFSQTKLRSVKVAYVHHRITVPLEVQIELARKQPIPEPNMAPQAILVRRLKFDCVGGAAVEEGVYPLSAEGFDQFSEKAIETVISNEFGRQIRLAVIRRLWIVSKALMSASIRFTDINWQSLLRYASAPSMETASSGSMQMFARPKMLAYRPIVSA
jgi:hypothetical protein